MTNDLTSAGKSRVQTDKELAHELLDQLARRTALQKRLRTLSANRLVHGPWYLKGLHLALPFMILAPGLWMISELVINGPLPSFDTQSGGRAMILLIGCFLQCLGGYTLLLTSYIDSHHVKHEQLIIESLLALEPQDA